MDLTALTLLVEILEAGNLSEAARRLKMSRASVSYHLNDADFRKSSGVIGYGATLHGLCARDGEAGTRIALRRPSGVGAGAAA